MATWRRTVSLALLLILHVATYICTATSVTASQASATSPNSTNNTHCKDDKPWCVLNGQKETKCMCVKEGCDTQGNPCKNNGTCVTIGNYTKTLACICPRSRGRVYTGGLCEESVERFALSKSAIIGIASGVGGAVILAFIAVIIVISRRKAKGKEVDDKRDGRLRRAPETGVYDSSSPYGQGFSLENYPPARPMDASHWIDTRQAFSKVQSDFLPRPPLAGRLASDFEDYAHLMNMKRPDYPGYDNLTRPHRPQHSGFRTGPLHPMSRQQQGRPRDFNAQGHFMRDNHTPGGRRDYS